MASSGQIKGITIKIEGDTSDLTKSLTKVNADIKKTGQALKDVERALKLDPGNTELLAQKQELLAKQIEQTSQKLELEKQAATDAKQALELGDITQEEYATLQAEVSNTASSLEELQSSAGDASDGLDEAGDSAEQAGEDAEESSAAFEEWGAVVAAAAAAAAAAVAAVGAALTAVGAALVNSTIETSQYADEVMTMSSVTGIATDTLQELNYASELLDVSTDTVTGSMTRLIRSMSSAQEGTGDTAEAFASLGVSVTDSEGNLRDSEEVFWDVIDALGEIDNETERDATAMSILGRSARDLNPLINAGSNAFEELAQEAHDAGYVMSGDTLDAFGDLDDNMRRLDNGAQAAKHAIGGILLPVLTNLSGEGVDFLNAFTNAVLETDGDVSQLGDVIEEMLPQAIAIFEENLPVILDLGESIITTLVDGIIANLDTILEFTVNIVLSIANGIIQYLPELMPSIVSLVMKIVDFLIENLPTIVTGAIQIVTSIAHSISDHLDILVPAVVDCILAIAEALTDPDTLVELTMAAIEIMVKLAEGLIDALPEVVDRIPEIIANIMEAFSDLGDQLSQNAVTWGSDLIGGLIQGIQSGNPALVNSVGGVASTIAAYLHHSTPDKGPLANDDQWGSDFVENWIDGMDSEQNNLEAAMYQTSDIIYEGMTGTDYSDALSGISGQLAGIGGGFNGTINVWLGTDRLGSVVVRAQNFENLRTGGTV